MSTICQSFQKEYFTNFLSMKWFIHTFILNFEESLDDKDVGQDGTVLLILLSINMCAQWWYLGVFGEKQIECNTAKLSISKEDYFVFACYFPSFPNRSTEWCAFLFSSPFLVLAYFFTSVPQSHEVSVACLYVIIFQVEHSVGKGLL